MWEIDLKTEGLATLGILNGCCGAGEMVQQLRTLSARAQDQSPVPSTYIMWLQLPVTPALGELMSTSDNQGHLHSVCTYEYIIKSF